MTAEKTKMVSAELANIWANWKVAVATNDDPTNTDAYWALRTWSCDFIVKRTNGKMEFAAPAIVDGRIGERSIDDLAAETIGDYLSWLDAEIRAVTSPSLTHQ